MDHTAQQQPTGLNCQPHAQLLQKPAPAPLYWPDGHTFACAFDITLPAGQLYPALHAPLHVEMFIADVAPNSLRETVQARKLTRDKSHTSNKPQVVIYCLRAKLLNTNPAAHNVHDAEPTTLYCPAGHVIAVAFGDPGPQA